MSQILEKNNIEVPDELKKPVDSSEHCHSTQFQGDIKFSLIDKLKSFPHISDIDSFFDISESEI